MTPHRTVPGRGPVWGTSRRRGRRGMCFGRGVTVADLLLLLVTGIAAGIVSTVASLASVVSYPVLLALGLPPLSANVTNTVSLLFTGVGAAAGSRPELAGQGGRIRRLGLVTALGGAAGAALLLLTPARTFEAAAPILIGAASLLLLLQAALPAPDAGHPGRERNPFLIAALFCVAIYVGYFGAAGGILLLVVLTPMLTEPLARTNAIKNVVSGLANAVAAVAFALFGPVRWVAVLPLAAGFLIGGRIGPILVALPAGPGAAGRDRPGRHRPGRQTRPQRVRLNSNSPQRKPLSPGHVAPVPRLKCAQKAVPGREDRRGTVFVAENFGFGVLLGGEPEHAERGQGEHRGRGLPVPRLRDGLDHAEVAHAAAAVVGRVGVHQFPPAARVRQPQPVVGVRAAGEVRHAGDHARAARAAGVARVVGYGRAARRRKESTFPAASFASIQLNPVGELSSAHIAGEPR